MSTYLKGTDQRQKEFDAKLATLLAEITTAAGNQFRYNEDTNIPAGIITPEQSVGHAILGGVVHALNAHLHWDCFAAINLAHDILEDANCHAEAMALRSEAEKNHN